MTTSPMDATFDALVAQRTWLEGLCRNLVRDDADAADTAQRTWLSALLHKDRVAAPRAWLAKVAKNHARALRRTASRADARDRAAGELQDHEARSSAEVNAAFETQRIVAAAVDALPEPFRTTVLLHWFEGMALNAIAARNGEPEGTVRWRLHRAHELLRQKLEARLGSDWRQALLPLCGLTLRRGSALAIAAIAAIVFGGVLWITQAFGTSLPPATTLDVAAASPGRERATEATGASARTTETAAMTAAPTPTAAAAATPAQAAQQAIVRLRVVADDEAPIAGATVRLRMLITNGLELESPLMALLIPSATTDSEGRAALALHNDARLLAEMPERWLPAQGTCWHLEFEARADGFLPARTRGRVGDGDDLDLGTVRLQPAVRCAGRVVDGDGNGIGGVTVAVFSPPIPDVERFVNASDFDGAIEVATTASLFSRGRYQFAAAPRGPSLVVAVCNGYRPAALHHDIAGDDGPLPDLRLEPAIAAQSTEAPPPLQILVIDASDNPVADAWVHLRRRHGSAMVRAGNDGRVQFGCPRNGQEWDTAPVDLVAFDGSGRHGGAMMTGVTASGDLVRLRLAASRPTTIRVRRPAGVDATPGFGAEAIDPAFGDCWFAGTNGDSWQLTPPSFAVRLVVSCAGCATWKSEPLADGAWPSEIVVELSAMKSIRGRVIANGAPVAGAAIEVVARQTGELRNGYRTGEWTSYGRAHTRTRSDGSFSSDEQGKGELRLVARAPGFAPAMTAAFVFDPAQSCEVAPIELGAGGTIRGRLRHRDGRPAARQFVGVNHELFGATTMLTGIDGRFEFADLAAGSYEVRPGDEVPENSSVTSSLPDGVANAAFPANVTVRAGVVTDVDLVVDQSGLRVACVRTDGKDLRGWSIDLLHDGITVAPRQALPSNGRIAFASPHSGGHLLRLCAPGGDFGELVVEQTVALHPGDGDVRIELDLVPWQGHVQLATPAESITLRLVAGDRTICAEAKATAGDGFAAALAPRGSCEAMVDGKPVGRVEVK